MEMILKRPFWFISALLFLLTDPGMGDELDDFLEDVGGSNTNLELFDLSPVGDFKEIDTLADKEKESEEKKYRQVIPENSVRRRYQEPRTFTVLIKEGSKLIDIETNQEFKTTRTFYARAREKVVGSRTSYILNNKGVIRYSTKTTNLIDVEEDRKLLPKVSALEVYEGKNSFYSFDKSLPLSHFFNYYAGAMATDYYANLFKGDSKRAFSYQFQLKNYYRSRSPINFGLGIYYNYGYWKDSNRSTLIWRGLFIGPTVHTSFGESENSSWHLHFGVGQSLYHDSQRGSYRHRYSSTFMQLELERAIHSRLGKFLIGGGIHLSQSSIKETDEDITRKPLKGQSIGLHLSVGHLSSWNL